MGIRLPDRNPLFAEVSLKKSEGLLSISVVNEIVVNNLVASS
jgi:hypothetical protein